MKSIISLWLLFFPCFAQAQNSDFDSLNSVTIVYGGANNHYPFEMIDEKGNISGFHIDLFREIAKSAGLIVQFKFQPWNQTRQDLEAGRVIDVTDMYYSESRDDKVEFSEPLEMVNYRVFVRPEDEGITFLEDLKEKEIIIEEGAMAQEELLALDFDVKIIVTETESDALLLLASGKHDYAIVSENHGFWYIRNHDIELYSTGSPVFPQRLCFAVKEGETELLDKINVGLQSVRSSGIYNELYYKWFGAPKPKSQLIIYVEEYGLWTLFSLFLFTGLIAVWSWSLRRTVRKRTEELRSTLIRLRKSDARLEKTQAFSLVMMSYLDLEGNFKKVPPTLCEFLGYSQEELLKFNIKTLLQTEDSSLIEKIQRLIQKERIQSYNIESQMKSKENGLLWVFINFSVILDEFDQPMELLLFIRDINNEKKAENKLLKKTQELNQLIFDNSPR